ncbi:biotin--[acetyl-CoA-carboxylase] ligase [Aurantiacibacter aquimixticola]|uniref:Biotin--[acetyl-CoA-carboxylase] ligase n=1 Tax=Aurantiacibacter aquimixticola TaxID=1958945 RepID=A0A419RS20_9SPHN|nr:biotin--[acetyl-CoA-carboxylase] ligase [Aurantiacibacter aquimixticola]RJY08566.1 biotin--[acetyl-CoA-carboxylase] ligase [Aurantiacibacter aquimixticola]
MREVVSETGSTNADLLARLAGDFPPPEGFWLMAERQTAGRGRLAREWESIQGNLHCSTPVHLKPSDAVASTLAFVAGLAVFDTVERSLLPRTSVMLKWPNDVLVREAKIAGVLLERQGNHVCVGIGINVSYSPEILGRKTTHIGYENGKFANGPESVLDLLEDRFAARLAAWRQQPLSHTLLEWAVRSHRYDDQLRVTDPTGERLSGNYRGIDHTGALRIAPQGSAERVLHAGDVMLGWRESEED